MISLIESKKKKKWTNQTSKDPDTENKLMIFKGEMCGVMGEKNFFKKARTGGIAVIELHTKNHQFHQMYIMY